MVRYGAGGGGGGGGDDGGGTEASLSFPRILKTSIEPEAVPQSKSVGDANDKQVKREDGHVASNAAEFTSRYCGSVPCEIETEMSSTRAWPSLAITPRSPKFSESEGSTLCPDGLRGSRKTGHHWSCLMLPQCVHKTCTSFGCMAISSLSRPSLPGSQRTAQICIELGYGGDGLNAGARLSFDAGTDFLWGELHKVLLARY